MTAADSVTYVETAATVRSLRLAHTSVEVGHLYMEELGDDDRVRAHFQRVRPWLAAVLADAEGTRVSTCVLLDDYTQRTSTARAAVDRLLRVADECGVRVDYLVRESGCDTTDDGVPVAELVYARLLPEPPPGTNGSRPPVQESGWLCNGERSDDIGSDQAMRAGAWQPPYEFGKRNHSVFLDVELVKTDPETGRKRWSCAFLSAVWQLLRMGMLRHHGEPVIAPTPWEDDAPWPEDWDDLPWIVQLRPDAEAFAAYRTLSIIPSDYIAVEHAVRLVLGHLALDQAEIDQVVARGAKEGLLVPRSATKRMSHVLYGEM
ncbi:SCO2522 family protein [Actinokineospora soli]